jgi:predicted Zn-dependent peptidase
MESILPKAERLDNGLEVWHVPLPRTHTGALCLLVGVGSRYEPAAKNGLSHLVEHAVFRGTRKFPSSHAFNTRAETCSSGFHAATYRDFTSFEASFLPEKLAEVLELGAELCAAPLLDEIDTERAIILEELGEDEQTRTRLPHVDELSKRELFPGSPFARPIGGTARLVSGFTTADCKAWHQRHYVAKNMLLVVAGPLEATGVRATVASAFRSLPAGERIAVEPAGMAQQLPRFGYEDDPHATQCEIQLTWVLPEPSHPDWPALRLCLGLLDAGTCGRLQKTLVDERGLLYELGAGLDPHGGLGLLIVDAAVSRNSAPAVVEAALQVVQSLAGEPPSAEEWGRLRERLRLDWAMMSEAASTVAFLVAQDRWLGVDPPFASLDALLAVRPEDLVRVARRWLSPQRLQVSAVGKLDGSQRAGIRRAIHRLRSSS